MSKYVIRRNGAINGFVIRPNSISEQTPVDESSQEWLDFLDPPVTDEMLRAEKIQEIKDEGVKRISAKVDALDNIGMILLVYKHMWPVANASQALLDGKDLADFAISRIEMSRTATRAQLEAYDAATDNGWPA